MHVLMSMCQNTLCTVCGLCQRNCLQCRSLQRETHYVDLEAQPAAGAGQSDLRHLLPTDSNTETAQKQAESTSESRSSSSASTTLDPAANMPIKAKSANAKEAKQPAKAESVSPPPLSTQDLATNIVQQVNPKVALQCLCQTCFAPCVA
jgi:hypothetical protein